ncbi:hypothetical protein [Variovorax paradoxus]|uniref:hypothetical protein n=1 Tax=Variovorax paradoxus TaxID=34073 RepID=UPI001ABC9018
MPAIHPTSFYEDLTDDRLRIIASSLMEIRGKTFSEMTSELDDNYTRETASFGRSRNMLIQACQAKKHSWLGLAHAGMDITFTIGSVPCRFFRDDAASPEKAGFFKRNAVDDLFADDDARPVMWRFVVEKAITEDDEDRVLFAGYNVYQEKISEWQYRDSAPTLHSVDTVVPASTILPPIDLDLHDEDKKDIKSDDDAEKSGTAD